MSKIFPFDESDIMRFQAKISSTKRTKERKKRKARSQPHSLLNQLQEQSSARPSYLSSPSSSSSAFLKKKVSQSVSLHANSSFFLSSRRLHPLTQTLSHLHFSLFSFVFVFAPSNPLLSVSYVSTILDLDIPSLCF